MNKTEENDSAADCPSRSSLDAEEIRIIFMGTPQFAVPSLEALLECTSLGGHPARVVAVATQPDRAAGRSSRLVSSPVKSVADAAGLPVLQPERIRRPESVARLRELSPDLIVVAAYAHILTPEILEIPRYGCINVHASLLPRWRGASPISAAILAGDQETGITLMRMDAGLDTGDILAQTRLSIIPDETTETLTARLARSSVALLTPTLSSWISGTIIPRKQEEEQAALTGILRREDGRIDWRAMPGPLVERMTRAYAPWPGTYTTLDQKGLKMWRAEPIFSLSHPEPGRVLTRDEASALSGGDAPWPRFLVATVDGALWLREVQAEGKRRMTGEEFLRGQPGAIGSRLV